MSCVRLRVSEFLRTFWDCIGTMNPKEEFRRSQRATEKARTSVREEGSGEEMGTSRSFMLNAIRPDSRMQESAWLRVGEGFDK